MTREKVGENVCKWGKHHFLEGVVVVVRFVSIIYGFLVAFPTVGRTMPPSSRLSVLTFIFVFLFSFLILWSFLKIPFHKQCFLIYFSIVCRCKANKRYWLASILARTYRLSSLHQILGVHQIVLVRRIWLHIGLLSLYPQ